MSVDNKQVIDYISIDKSNKVILTISDHLKWNVKDHLIILQDKINAYLEFIETGQIYEIYPDAQDKKFVIQIAMKYLPNNKAGIFLINVRDFLNSNGYEFKFFKSKDDE